MCVCLAAYSIDSSLFELYLFLFAKENICDQTVKKSTIRRYSKVCALFTSIQHFAFTICVFALFVSKIFIKSVEKRIQRFKVFIIMTYVECGQMPAYLPDFYCWRFYRF